MNERKIYIVISQTPTRFAKCIRKFGNIKFNHAAISFDKELKQIYAFARPQYYSYLLGHLVKESINSYTLNKDMQLQCMVFELSVSIEEYQTVRALVDTIRNDSEYMYNLFSVLTFPVTKGFEVYKAFTCIEFIVLILQQLGYSIEKPYYAYRPDDLMEILHDYKIYEGDIRGILSKENIDKEYFAPITMEKRVESAVVFCKLCKRSIIRKPHYELVNQDYRNIMKQKELQKFVEG